MKIQRLFLLSVACVLMGLQLTPSCAQSNQTLRVAIKPLTPFVMKQGEAYTSA